MMGEVSDLSHIDRLMSARDAVAAVVRALDVERLDAGRAGELVDVFGAIERLGAAGKALAAKRVADTEGWRASGAGSAADWLARCTGSTVGAARGALEAAGNLPAGSSTDAAFRAGALSIPQAEAIASAITADPSAEDDLLSRAAAQPLKKLQDECARVRAAATDVAEHHARLHQRRSLRTWTDAEGARCGMWKLTPEAGAEVERALQPFTDAAFEAARRAGEREASEAYAADGLVAMAKAATGSGETPRERRRRRREGIVLVNLESLQRGSVAPGELCEIPGVGPVPVDVARDLLGDALLRLVIVDGVDVKTVVHAGRVASEAQRIAIQVQQRGCCLRPSCARPVDQIDHTIGFPITGSVTLEALGGLCAGDHLLKTSGGHSYQRGEHGWEWIRPDGVVERDHDPP